MRKENKLWNTYAEEYYVDLEQYIPNWLRSAYNSTFW